MHERVRVAFRYVVMKLFMDRSVSRTARLRGLRQAVNGKIRNLSGFDIIY